MKFAIPMWQVAKILCFLACTARHLYWADVPVLHSRFLLKRRNGIRIKRGPHSALRRPTGLACLLFHWTGQTGHADPFLRSRRAPIFRSFWADPGRIFFPLGTEDERFPQSLYGALLGVARQPICLFSHNRRSQSQKHSISYGIFPIFAGPWMTCTQLLVLLEWARCWW